MNAARPDYAREVRRALHDPAMLVRGLDLLDGSERRAGGIAVRCPAHEERNPSCSITRGPDGTLRARCFSCGWTADALGLISTVRRIDLHGAFREVLAVGAELAGDVRLADEIRGDTPPSPRPAPRAAPPPVPPREFPPSTEVQRLWNGAGPTAENPTCSSYLRSRGFDPGAVDVLGLCRALSVDRSRWARFGGEPWRSTGHRMLVRAWDARGTLVTLRAWQVMGRDGPKRLPPAGHRCMGIVLANGPGVAILRGRGSAGPVVVVEGEPDFVAWSLMSPALPVLGIGSGWWSADHAARIPSGSRVALRTHQDRAGEQYAAAVALTLAGRCETLRLRDGAPGDEADRYRAGALTGDPFAGCGRV